MNFPLGPLLANILISMPESRYLKQHIEEMNTCLR